jgi:hypothetical protein
MILVLFGHNLFNHHPTVMISQYPGIDRLRFFLRKSRLIYLLDEYSAALLEKYRPSRRQPVDFRPPGRWMAYRASLANMADQARRRGIRLALCTVPGNLQFPPLDPDSVRWDPEFLETKYLYLTGQRKAAVRKFQLLLSRRPEAWWNFQLGEWLYQAGRYSQARAHLMAARDEDAMLQRATSGLGKGGVLAGFRQVLLRNRASWNPGLGELLG